MQLIYILVLTDFHIWSLINPVYHLVFTPYGLIDYWICVNVIWSTRKSDVKKSFFKYAIEIKHRKVCEQILRESVISTVKNKRWLNF